MDLPESFLSLPGRSVLKNLFSGLGVRDPLFARLDRSGASIDPMGGEMADSGPGLVLAFSFVDFLLMMLGRFGGAKRDGGADGADLRLSKDVGGTVPPPSQPCVPPSLGPFWLGPEIEVRGKLVFDPFFCSSRLSLSASSRSTRSLQRSSIWRNDSRSAFSVSDRGRHPDGIL